MTTLSLFEFPISRYLDKSGVLEARAKVAPEQTMGGKPGEEEGESGQGACVRAATLQPWLTPAQEAAENTPSVLSGVELKCSFSDASLRQSGSIQSCHPVPDLSKLLMIQKDL